ncbi:tectonic-3-like [Amphibalanus amphitrite]|uniref:tectonic-3-like n=1 Tax=Amphibalanus amphitrite TaxID=1232801 RepID=UPI001C91AD0E|nr:tectonic-3-like [Amphibalanus amphitrite]
MCRRWGRRQVALLLALLAAAAADTVSEFDRCVLGDCLPLQSAGGAAPPPAYGVGGRHRDGASVMALKRSAENGPGDPEQLPGETGPTEGEDTRYCVQSDHIYRSNDHQLTPAEGGLLCVVRDNLVGSFRLPRVKPAASSVEFDRLVSRAASSHRYGGWSPPAPPPVTAVPAASSDRYRSGDLLWAVGKGPPRRWELQWRGPVSSGVCDALRPVRFLRSAHTDCWLTADAGRLTPLDGRNMYRDLCLLRAPPGETGEDPKPVRCVQPGDESTDTDQDTAVAAVPYLCDIDHLNCTQVSEVRRPRVSGDRLRDALVSALLVVEQRSGRVAAVRALLVLADVPLGSAVRQRRRVEFRRPAAEAPRLRSGNPGYQRRRPLLAAPLAVNVTDDGETRREPAAPGRPLLLPSPGRGGGCSTDRRRWRPLAFGVDASVGCRLEAAAGDCAALQRRLLDTLLSGLPAAAAETAVFAFGSGERDGEWVPVVGGRPQLSPETTRSGCRGLVTSLHWRVLVARTGAAQLPQTRVVGVRLQFGRPRPVWTAPESGGRLSVTLHTSVAFQDVTAGGPEPHFARPPRVDLSLPADFFYPFSSGGAGGGAGKVPALAALVALLLAV